jgi:threonine dehydratase
MTNCAIYMKSDFQQFTGSFKERGARNALMALNEQDRKKGVVAASAGNHATALAYHGKLLNIPVIVVMPSNAPITKRYKAAKLGAQVILHGEHIGEAKEFALKEYPDLKYINGYDDPEIIAGAGTMGIEIMEQVRDVDVVIVPIGGAGLIAGVSLAVKAINPKVQIIGVEPSNVASYAAAIEAGKPVYEFRGSTIADGLAVPMVGPTSFNVARRFVDSTCVVSERLIATAMLKLIEMESLVVEGGGATALAAVMPGGPLFNKFQGKNVVLLLCGGNVDITVVGRIIDRGLAVEGRLVRFSATVSDRPGGIAKISAVLAELNVSVKEVYHERAWLHNNIDEVNIKWVVECTGKDHAQQMFRVLEAQGYKLEKDVSISNSFTLP